MSEFDPWEQYKDIPKGLHPIGSDINTLFDILTEFKSAVRVRHDFQASAASVERRLRRDEKWESQRARYHVAAASGTSSSSSPPPLADLADEHRTIARDAKVLINSLKNAELKTFLALKYSVMFPDIGYSSLSGDAVRRLRPAKGVLDNGKVDGVTSSDLVRLLRKPLGAYSLYW